MQSATNTLEDLFSSLRSSLKKLQTPEGVGQLIGSSKLSLLSLFGDFEQTRDALYDKRSSSMRETHRKLVQLTGEFEAIVKTMNKLSSQVNNTMVTLYEFHKSCDQEVEGEAAIQAEFREMWTANNKLKQLVQDFSSSAVSCSSLLKNALANVDTASKEAANIVDVRRTDFDMYRRKIQVREAAVRNAEAKGANPAMIEMAQRELRDQMEDLQLFGDEYMNSVQDAMINEGFALEQASMTTWSAANVFFVQLGLLLSEATNPLKTMANSLNGVKCTRKVSKQISQQKHSAFRRLPPQQPLPPEARGRLNQLNDNRGSAAADESGFQHPVATVDMDGSSDFSASNPQLPTPAVATAFAPTTSNNYDIDLFGQNTQANRPPTVSNGNAGHNQSLNFGSGITNNGANLNPNAMTLRGAPPSATTHHFTENNSNNTVTGKTTQPMNHSDPARNMMAPHITNVTPGSTQPFSANFAAPPSSNFDHTYVPTGVNNNNNINGNNYGNINASDNYNSGNNGSGYPQMNNSTSVNNLRNDINNNNTGFTFNGVAHPASNTEISTSQNTFNNNQQGGGAVQTNRGGAFSIDDLFS